MFTQNYLSGEIYLTQDKKYSKGVYIMSTIVHTNLIVDCIKLRIVCNIVDNPDLLERAMNGN